jgi:DnaJ-class molecular chaperone
MIETKCVICNGTGMCTGGDCPECKGRGFIIIYLTE